MSKKEKNLYYELVENIVSNKLPLTIVFGAIEESFRRRPDIPEGVKNLVVPRGGSGRYCPLKAAFQLVRNIVGIAELTYRRGMQAGDEKHSQ